MRCRVPASQSGARCHALGGAGAGACDGGVLLGGRSGSAGGAFPGQALVRLPRKERPRPGCPQAAGGTHLQQRPRPRFSRPDQQIESAGGGNKTQRSHCSPGARLAHRKTARRAFQGAAASWSGCAVDERPVTGPYGHRTAARGHAAGCCWPLSARCPAQATQQTSNNTTEYSA